MKVNSVLQQAYNVNQNRPVTEPTTTPPAKINQFSQARFTDLLSSEEKKFITENFKADNTSKADTQQLGRFLDVTA